MSCMCRSRDAFSDQDICHVMPFPIKLTENLDGGAK